MAVNDGRDDSAATAGRDNVLEFIYSKDSLESFTEGMNLKQLRRVHDIFFDESIRISKEADRKNFGFGKLKASVDNTFEHHSKEMCTVNIAYCTRNSCDDYDPGCVSRKIKGQLRKMRDIILEKAALAPDAVDHVIAEAQPEEVSWVEDLSESGIIEELSEGLSTVSGIRKSIILTSDGRVIDVGGSWGSNGELASASIELWKESISYIDRIELGVFHRSLIEFGKLRFLLVSLNQLAVVVLMDEDASLGLVELFVDKAVNSIESDILKAKEI